MKVQLENIAKILAKLQSQITDLQEKHFYGRGDLDMQSVQECIHNIKGDQPSRKQIERMIAKINGTIVKDNGVPE